MSITADTPLPVLRPYNAFVHFSDFDLNSVRAAEQIYDRARTHTSPAKAYAKQNSGLGPEGR